MKLLDLFMKPKQAAVEMEKREQEASAALTTKLATKTSVQFVDNTEFDVSVHTSPDDDIELIKHLAPKYILDAMSANFPGTPAIISVTDMRDHISFIVSMN